MKRIYYLLAIVAIAFTACQKQPIVGLGGSASNEVKIINVTLAAADYKMLDTTVYAYKSKTFKSDADAKLYIPIILNKSYPQLSNGSIANVSYSSQFVVADSVYSHLTYTLTNADYLLLPKNTFTDFSIAQVITWLPFKYTSPVDNQQVILNFTYYDGSTSIPKTTYAFVYTNKTWVQAYMITPAQYAAIGHGSFNQFVNADNANLPAYLNSIMKADPLLMATAKAGNVQYVSFNFYNSTKPAVTSQRVLPLVFDGTNWLPSASGTLGFVKSGGTWIPDPTVYYTVGGVGSADLTLIGGSGIGGNALSGDVTSLVKYGDFDTYWMSLSTPNPTSYLNQAFILILTKDFPTPKLNTPYKVTFLYYTGGKDVSTIYTFTYNGTAWVAAQ
jgi:hypothetical protein